VDSISTLDAIVAQATAPWRFTSWLLAALATVAFVMTTAGLFSVVSLEVANRRYELAIRSALGAERAELLRCVLVAVGTPAIAGLLVGIFAAGTLTGVVRGFLFRVSVFDPVTWSAVLTMVVGVAGIAAFIPARDAASVDLVTLMRR
jgi:putative ABC transport system permease protein